jgi:hypothetical protein
MGHPPHLVVTCPPETLRVVEAAVEEALSSASKIKLLLEAYEQDRRHVMLFVTICFAIPAFTLAHMPPKEVGFAARSVLFASLLAFIVAGLLYFRYAQYQNWKRLHGVRFILAGDLERLYDELMGPKNGLWASHRWWYQGGGWLLRLASGLYIAFLAIDLFRKV